MKHDIQKYWSELTCIYQRTAKPAKIATLSIIVKSAALIERRCIYFAAY